MLISAIIAAAIKRDWPPRCDVSRAVGGPCGMPSSARAALASSRAPCFLIFFISLRGKGRKISGGRSGGREATHKEIVRSRDTLSRSMVLAAGASASRPNNVFSST